MSVVGAFPGFSDFRRRTIRAPSNPMDKSTIVSIFPRMIDETKHTIQPGRFIIPAGSYEKPSILVVGSSSWWKEIDEEQPLLEIPNSSIQVADSIVNDWCNGLLGCNMSDIMPGIFWVPGEFTEIVIKTKYKNLMDKALANQRRWYEALVKMADSLWARSNGNPLAITNDMRLAVQELNLASKDWMQDFSTISKSNCPACGFMINPAYPVCSNCKNILDKDKAEKLGLMFAK
jgi:hypothetical protein